MKKIINITNYTVVPSLSQLTTKRTFALLLLYCLLTDDSVSRQVIQQTGRVALGCRQDRMTKLAHYFSSFQVELIKTRTVLND